MCIRDRRGDARNTGSPGVVTATIERVVRLGFEVRVDLRACLLYTSDAADERSSVDLGGRRIIKKKEWSSIL